MKEEVLSSSLLSTDQELDSVYYTWDEKKQKYIGKNGEEMSIEDIMCNDDFDLPTEY